MGHYCLRAMAGLALAVLLASSCLLGTSCSGQEHREVPRLEETDLTAIWASSSSDVFAVGGTAVFHYDGSAWSPMALPYHRATAFLGIHGTSPQDVFLVGDQGTVLHYNGESWSRMITDTRRTLCSVWATSTRDAFAVGEEGTILRFEGLTWRTMRSGTSARLRSVWSSSPDSAFAVGEPWEPGEPAFLHYDGHAWRDVTLDGPALLAGLPSEDRYRVEEIFFLAVWGRGPKDVYAAGLNFGVNCICGPVVHYDGNAWSTQAYVQGHNFSAIAGYLDSSDLYALSLDGTLSRYLWTGWIDMRPPAPTGVSAICCVPPSQVFTGGKAGTVMRFDGSSWKQVA